MSDQVTICVCGTTSPVDARYCEGCGRPVDVDELLDLEELAEAGGRPGRGGGADDDSIVDRRRFWLPVAIGLALIAGAVGVVVLTGGDTPEAEVDPEEAEQEEADDGEAARGGDDSEADDDEGTVDEVGDDGAASAVVKRYEPLSGESDFAIIVGTSAGTAVFDAGTGELRHHEGRKGIPVAAHDGWLVFERQEGSGVQALPLDDLGGLPRPFRAGGIYSSFLSASPRDGLVVVETQDEAGPALVIMDIAGQEVVPHPVTELAFADLLFGPPVVTSADEALFTPVSGGVYHLDDEGPRRLAPGRMLVTDGERTLVESCDPAFTCTRAWVDRDGEPLDLALPPSEHGAMAFAYATDWVASNAAPGRGVTSTITLTNIVTGRVLETRGTPIQGLGFFWWGTAPPISPDGRWVVSASSGSDEVEIRNLVTDEVRQVELPYSYASGLVFAATSP